MSTETLRPKSLSATREALVTSSALDTYVAGLDPAVGPLVRSLDEIVTATHPGFDVAVKYQLLMYSIAGDWRHWVCAIGPTRRGAGLRFLYGVLLDDPPHVLRAGSSVLKTWDFGVADALDPAAVGAYVREAVVKYPEYAANSETVLAEARAAARSTGSAGRRRSGS